MASLNMRENFMRCMTGGVPEFVPRYGMGADPYSTMPQQVGGLGASYLERRTSPEGNRIDMWGVEYVATEDTGGQALPKPGVFLIDDIRNWRDIVKAPDLSHIDWDALAKKDIDNMTYDRTQVAVTGSGGGGYFLNHMNLMGFSNGLMSYYEEPDEVKALYQYWHDYYTLVNKEFMPRYPIDIYTVGDDYATALTPFISPEMYREFIKPFITEDTRAARERGMPIMMHNCGRCEDTVEDWMDFGCNSWNPAQITNDLEGIKKKHGNKMILIGCWDSSGPVGWDSCTEELMRSEVKRVIDTFAPGGGFIFWGSTYGPPTHEPLINRRKWMTSEYEARRFDPYK